MEKVQDRKQDNLREMKEDYVNRQMPVEEVEAMKKKIADAKARNKKERKKRAVKATAAVAAAAAAVFVLLPNTSANVAHAMSGIPVFGKLVEIVTFRDYQYESERQNANISVPELVPGDTAVPGEDASGAVQENLKKSTEEINAEIQAITDKIVAEFEANAGDQEGYQDVLVKSEVLATTEDYFTLKLICYQGAGSGAEWDYFYTIDLKTGERVALADLFTEGADYVSSISENIKDQMRAQMAADANLCYWVDYEEVPAWNFEKITDETAFYLNENGRLVICFNEGDVAPMYMGCVEFEIPEEALAGIRR